MRGTEISRLEAGVASFTSIKTIAFVIFVFSKATYLSDNIKQSSKFYF